MTVTKQKKIREPLGDKVFNVMNYIFLGFFFLVVAYPLIYVVSASFSDSNAVISGEVWLWPVGFNIEAYKTIFQEKSIMTGYMNTIIYTVFGTIFNLILTTLAAYPLSRKKLFGKRIVTWFFMLTMFFSGGLIPTYFVVKDLNLINSRWSVIMMGCVSVYNIILIRSFCESSLSEELLNATKIDGCGNGRFFFQFVIPLSKAIIAVIALYVAVGYWNSYYHAIIYINDDTKHPLQLLLRQLLMTANNATDIQDGELAGEYLKQVQVVKYAVIVVATAPIMCIYPFLQKYFVQGVMIGAIKG